MSRLGREVGRVDPREWVIGQQHQDGADRRVLGRPAQTQGRNRATMPPRVDNDVRQIGPPGQNP